MEIMLRCALPDEPGSLATLAGTIAELGGDIQAVDVVEHTDGHVLDDLLVVIEGEGASALLARVAALPGVELVHAGPSRGHPGDAVTRLAFGLEALILGQSTRDNGLATLIGGQLRAAKAEMVPKGQAPRNGGKTLVLDVDDRALVLQRDYRFTATERERAEALVRLCLIASR